LKQLSQNINYDKKKSPDLSCNSSSYGYTE